MNHSRPAKYDVMLVPDLDATSIGLICGSAGAIVGSLTTFLLRWQRDRSTFTGEEQRGLFKEMRDLIKARDRRIELLEAKIENGNSRHETCQMQVAAQQVEIATLRQSVETLRSQIVTLEQKKIVTP